MRHLFCIGLAGSLHRLRRFGLLSLSVFMFMAASAIAPPVKADPAPQQHPIVYRLTIKGAITPATMNSLRRAIDKANAKADELNQSQSIPTIPQSSVPAPKVALLVSLDTPGGLMSSMDEMIRDIINAKVPVITYVSPVGASCGSAGVYIMMASHVAAMAPATNIGSATPVTMSGPGGGQEKSDQPKDDIPETAGADDALNMKRKIMHHAIAQIRSLAEFHGRNANFAEQTITRAENVTASQALQLRAIDLIASNETELLQKLEGRSIRMADGTTVLSFKDSETIDIHDDFRDRLLLLIADPNLAYILMMIGIMGIMAEIQYPGAIFPGVIGSISLILALYAMQTLSVSWAGFGLIVLGFIFFILEVKIMSYGLLSVAGAVSILIGSIMMARSGDDIARVSLITALTVSATTMAFSLFLVYKAAQAMHKKPVGGDARLLEDMGTALSEVTEKGGRVFIYGEYWNARSTDNEQINAGAKIRVVRRDGMILVVKKGEV